MNDDSVLTALAQCNPVPEIAPYDEVGEARLADLLSTFRVGRARRSRRVRGWSPAGVAVTVSVGLVVALLSVGLVVDHHPPTQPSRPTITYSQVHGFPTADASTPAGVVIARSVITLNVVTYYILQSNGSMSGSLGPVGKTISWEDEGAPANYHFQAFDSEGKPQLDIGQVPENGSYVFRSVAYPSRQYVERSASSPDGLNCCVTNGAVAIAQELESGTDWSLSTSTIDGHTELVLSKAEPSINRTILVDPTTYLPRREIVSGFGGNDVTDYVWIPRADESARRAFLLLPSVPTGFVKVPQFR